MTSCGSDMFLAAGAIGQIAGMDCEAVQKNVTKR